MRIPAKNIVLATVGSLGDLHPYLAVAIGLRERGHTVTIATMESYRQKVEAAGLRFHAASPDISDFGDQNEFMAKIMDPLNGPIYLIREMVMPYLRQSYDQLNSVVKDADMLITHPLTMSAHLIAEQRQATLAWGSVALAPFSFWSVYDPPVLGPMPAMRHLYPLGPLFFRQLLNKIKRDASAWTLPWHAFRRELGLPATTRDPLFEGQYSPEFTLALFSSVLGAPQKDWPPNTTATGFPFYDKHDGHVTLPPDLAAFLDAGDPPLVFTLGSSAVMDAGPFYRHSIEAAQLLHRRAVLLVGRNPRNLHPGKLPDGIAAFEYAPFSALFPRAAAIIHQGGVGTTGQALHAGRPMLVVPFGFDQPDNAHRVTRLGVARTLPRHHYTTKRAAAELAKLLQNPAYAQRAAEITTILRKENGIRTACDLIEKHLRQKR